jgi:hypothetical protein
MRTKILSFTAFMLILGGSFLSCDKEDNNPEKFRLSKILYYANSTSANPTDGVEYTYDEAGNLVKESFYGYVPTTELYMYYEYEYSGNKKITMKTFRGSGGNFRLNWYNDYFYEGNHLIKDEYREADGSISYSVNYEYMNGNIIREYFFEPDYGISAEVKYGYDAQNRLILEEKNTSDVDDCKYIKHIYDDIDRKTKSEYYDVNQKIIRYVEVMYNGRSKLPVQDVHYDKDGVQTSQYQHFYDKQGNLTETIYNNECSLFKRKFKNGLLIEEILYTDPTEKKGCLETQMSRYEYEKFK